jgi:hypothetical protein
MQHAFGSLDRSVLEYVSASDIGGGFKEAVA